MEETFPIKGIILGREPFRERDSKVCVYSLQRGRQDLIARGTKKITSKLAGHIEPVSLVNIMAIRGRSLVYLGSALEDRSYKEIKSDLGKIYYAGAALKLFKELVREGAPDKDIFNLLKNYLDIIENKEPDNEKLELLFNFFVLRLLCLLGYKPELDYCVKCRKKIISGLNYFNPGSGGLVCGICWKKNGLTISDSCVKLLRLVLNQNLGKLSGFKTDNKTAKETINIICSFLQFYKP